MKTTVRIIAFVAKFIFIMLAATVVCIYAWDAFLNGKVYSCTDGGTMDYMFPGNWVHPHDGHAVAVVPKIPSAREMSDPDTIKQGWSIRGLWCVWLSFLGTSLVVSFLLASVSWIKAINWFSDWHHGRVQAS